MSILTTLIAIMDRADAEDIAFADCARYALEAAARRAGARRARLTLEPAADGPTEPIRFFLDAMERDDEPMAWSLPMIWGEERIGLLALDVLPEPGVATELALIAGMLAPLHRRETRLRTYLDARRRLRNTRRQLEQQKRALELQHRDSWSTAFDLHAILDAAAEDDDHPHGLDTLTGLLGDSRAMQRLRIEVQHAARLDLPMLIEGETGTGKDLVARAIHRLGLRAHLPLLDFSCAATPLERIEVELCGYEAGAFSGASRKQGGLLAALRGGTLLLDEVVDVPLVYQTKLLRAVEGKPIRPLGGEARALDFQVIATTRSDADRALADGRFDRALFFRLAVHRLRLPPLREHPEDIPILVERFLQDEGASITSKMISSVVWDRLNCYPWPGNVRELRNLVSRWTQLADDRIDEGLLPPEIARAADLSRPLPPPRSLMQFEYDTICRALLACQGDKAEAARRLGITRTTLYAKLRKARAESRA